MGIDSFCLSSYLAFRYIAKPGYEWIPGIGPKFPEDMNAGQIPVGSPNEILDTLRKLVNNFEDIENTGILLSGGIDSAILAALLPKGSRAYTINFAAKTGANEAKRAALYANAYALRHTVINVDWEDYLIYEPLLMSKKRAPLHAVEVALYKASLKAIEDGLSTVVIGNGADSTFGGLDKLLSRDWTFDAFMERYTFIDPASVLKAPVSVREIYAPYKRGANIDYIQFLKTVHGLGVIQAFNNSTEVAGIGVAEPFEQLQLKGKLNLERIRAGEPKYLLVDVFKKLYPNLEPPRKIPFRRPMDEWLADYIGPKSDVFKSNIAIGQFSGDQKYLIRGLDTFVRLLEEGKI